MAKCKWCNKVSDNLFDYTDAMGETHSICGKCKQVADDCLCRKCGNPVDPSLMINGLCTNCVQVDMRERSKRREEVRLGVDRDFLDSITSDLEFSEDDYERWVTMGNEFSPDNMKHKEYRRLWIMVKFNAAGIYDSDTISNNFISIEKLLDRNFSKLVNNKCRILIGNSPDTRKIVKDSEVIDYEDQVYILKA